ncbi:MAG: hypothetical protein K0B08_06865 [Bacteroidales bacterium]|nr:hypothetical protein [Bacteroidales bacterium]
MNHKFVFCFVLAILVVLSVSSSSAQEERAGKPVKGRTRLLDRMDFGGYLGAQFGTITMVNVSPQVTYRITEKFHAGLGINYLYYRDKRFTPPYSLSAYGGSVFTRYFVWRDLFAHLEYAPLYISFPDYHAWVHDLMVGGGYRQWLGQRSYVVLMVLFNVNESFYSPYSNPIIRIGFGIGF